VLQKTVELQLRSYAIEDLLRQANGHDDHDAQCCRHNTDCKACQALPQEESVVQPRYAQLTNKIIFLIQ
jgi:hypothetical protein